MKKLFIPILSTAAILASASALANSELPSNYTGTLTISSCGTNPTSATVNASVTNLTKSSSLKGLGQVYRGTIHTGDISGKLSDALKTTLDKTAASFLYKETSYQVEIDYLDANSGSPVSIGKISGTAAAGPTEFRFGHGCNMAMGYAVNFDMKAG